MGEFTKPDGSRWFTNPFGGAAFMISGPTQATGLLDAMAAASKIPNSNSSNTSNAQVSSATPAASQTSSPTSTPTPQVQPTPILPSFVPLTNISTIVKQAPKDTIVFNESSVDPALLQELLYQDIASMELINISREDLIDGQEVSYSPIVNLTSVKRQYDPNNIIAVGSSAKSYFSRFGIDLILRGMNEPYLDADGNLIIEIDTIEDDENIEVEVLATGTINEVDI
jgi:hypothetical protein